MTRKSLIFTHLLLFLLLALMNANAQSVEIKLLEPSQTVERELAGGQTHKYKFDAKANELLQIKVEQKGIDVVVRLLDSGDKKLAEIDSPNGTNGFENLIFISDVAGTYTIEVSSLEADAGKGNYTIFRETPLVATELDRSYLKAKTVNDEADALFYEETAESFAAALPKFREATRLYLASGDKLAAALTTLNEGFINNRLGNKTVALEIYKKVLTLFQEIGNKEGEATTLNNIGQVYYELGENQKALEFYDKSLKISRAAGDKYNEAKTLNNIGSVYYYLGENQKALDYYNQSLPIKKAIGDKNGEARTLNNIGAIYDAIGEKQKALEFYNRVLPIVEEVGEKNGQAMTLNNIGLVYDSLGDKRKALEYYNKSLPLTIEVGDKASQAVTVNNIGAIYESLGERQKALEFYNQALTLFRAVEDKSGEARVLNNIAYIYSYSGENQKAFDFYNKALTIQKASGDKSGQANTLNNIGTVYSFIGEKQTALEYFNQSLPLRRAVEDKSGEATTLINIGGIYDGLGNAQKALEFYEKALILLKAVGDKSGEATALSNIGTIYSATGNYQKALEYFNQALPLRIAVEDKNGEAVTLNNIGRVYFDSGDNKKALEFYNQALSLVKKSEDRIGEATILGNIGGFYTKSDANQKAVEYFNESLAIHKSLGNKNGEAGMLNNLMFAWSELKNPRFAAFYGKQSVNKIQNLRGAISGLDKNLQKSFLTIYERTYKKLAEILIADGRIVEAEQVLALLKQEEVFDYLRRDASEAAKLSGRADLTEQESASLKKYEEFGDKITELGTEFGELQKLQISGVALTGEQEKRYEELAVQLEDASRSFQVFLREIAGEFGKRTNTEKDLQENIALQSDLKSWGEGVVFIYTLVGEERYRTILITPDTQTDGKTEISAADLNKKISDFRQIVQNPKLDPRPLGKELYDILIKPIEKQLEGAKAKTLLWSLDGNTRLLPLAALWDGEQYFGQKYQNVTITLASRTRLNDAPTGNWKVLGLGVSESKTVKGENGMRDVTFTALPSVPSELSSIVQTENSKGVLPGQSLLNAEFTEKNLKSQLLRDYKVIHIASHFSMNAGDATKSFLLLGDGGILTVDEIKNSPLLKFSGVELLTLSACQTAVTGKDSSGKEIEGFGYVAQQKGAKAILATLWSVADESTQLLMTEFYRLRKENPKLTKAEAMQTAQNAMIEGKLKPTKTGAEDRSGVFMKDENKLDALKFDIDKKKPYSHPFYWSPFVLIGNWK